MDKVIESANQIINYYEEILSQGQFEIYEKYQDVINALFDTLQNEDILSHHKQELARLYKLHQDVRRMTEREYNQLQKEKSLVDQKKKASSVYRSDNVEYNSIFFDQKR